MATVLASQGRRLVSCSYLNSKDGIGRVPTRQVGPGRRVEVEGDREQRTRP
jgi:hypothetical protein